MKSQTRFQPLLCSYFLFTFENRYFKYIESFLKQNVPFILQIINRVDSTIEVADIIVRKDELSSLHRMNCVLKSQPLWNPD